MKNGRQKGANIAPKSFQKSVHNHFENPTRNGRKTGADWAPQKEGRWQRRGIRGGLVICRFCFKNQVFVWEVCKFRLARFLRASKEGVLGEVFQRNSSRKGGGTQWSDTPVLGRAAAADLQAPPLPPAPTPKPEFRGCGMGVRGGSIRIIDYFPNKRSRMIIQ